MTALLLLLPRSDADTRLAERIDSGQELLNVPIHNQDALRELWAEHKAWHEYNARLLATIFDESDEIVENYEYRGPRAYFQETLQQQVQSTHRDIQTHINRLRSLREQLELFIEPDDADRGGSLPEVAPPTHGSSVFIVHGHQMYHYQVSDFLRQLGLNPIILNEQVHRGATLIEKLERDSADCGFVIVVYTGDDIGMRKPEPDTLVRSRDWVPRARENVVFELGYFFARLGRARVAVLLEPGVEFPSDFDGVGYYELGTNTDWKARLEGELRAADLLR